jgi:peptidoglycan/LPS O-acetylase OafA/YrhL
MHRAGWVLENKALVWVGKISYGWYLWHQIIWHIHPAGHEFNGILAHGAAAMLALVPTVLSYYFVERPVQVKLKARFERARATRGVSALEPAGR